MTKYFYKWRFGWTIKKNMDKKIMTAITPYSIFLRLRDCVDLPMRINRYLPVPMTPRQSRYINELRDEFSLSIPEESFDFKYIFPIIMKQRQIASGFIYIPGKKTKVFDTNKLAALNAVLEEIDAKKRVIWCSFQEEANQIISCVPESHTVSVLSTNTDHENTSALSRFRDDKNILNLITTYDILESGETLTSAQYAVHYSCPWSNAVYRNAKHRIFRKGAEIHDKIIYIHIFVRDSIEEIILQTLQKKMNMQTKLKSYIKEWLR